MRFVVLAMLLLSCCGDDDGDIIDPPDASVLVDAAAMVPDAAPPPADACVKGGVVELISEGDFDGDLSIWTLTSSENPDSPAVQNGQLVMGGYNATVLVDVTRAVQGYVMPTPNDLRVRFEFDRVGRLKLETTWTLSTRGSASSPLVWTQRQA